MGFFTKKSTPMMDAIRCDEQSYLIWKWRPAGAGADSKRADTIRWGSSLRVRDGSVGVLVYNQPDGSVYEYIEGPADMILETYNLPILADLIGKVYNGSSPFQAEVYFINLAELIQVPFGVPFFDVFDPRFLDFGVPVAVRGTISFKITDYRGFIRLHRLDNFDLKDFQTQIRSAVAKTVKGVVTNAPTEHNIPVVQLERKIQQINDLVEDGLKRRLYQDFGVSVSSIDISAIELDRSSEGYRQLKAVTQDLSAATLQAQTAVSIKNMEDTQRIQIEHQAETLKAQREEAKYAQRIQTQTEHLATHQLNQQTAVGIAGAEALGRMGAGNAVGGNGSMNPAAMMAGMAVGGAIGQSVAGVMSGMMSGVTQPLPPPLPFDAPTYHVAVNGKAEGPYQTAELKQMAAFGTLTGASLVWKPGMTSWIKADDIPELQKLFDSGEILPPPIP